MDVISKACRGNYRYIDCIGEEKSEKRWNREGHIDVKLQIGWRFEEVFLKNSYWR